ncbi:MAG: hypothetical protein HC835_19795, partial [Oscillatoriales cyanobacterium RM2_1_1]|nr:hypothetical protein [Oscillatoriales cyanobacterium RM2_1_1]
INKDAKYSITECRKPKKDYPGMTMIHHQLHSVQKFTRSCVECHRSSATYGMGSVNYRLARHFFYAITNRGLETVAVEKKELGKSVPVATLELEDVESFALTTDKVHGQSEYGFAAVGGEEIIVIDLKNPAFPTIANQIKLSDVQNLLVSGNTLVACCGKSGIALFDIKQPKRPKLMKTISTEDARSADLAWPYLYVADGPGGLKVLDISDLKTAQVIASLKLTFTPQQGSVVQNKNRDSATLVKTFFQYGRLNQTGTGRNFAFQLVLVADDSNIHMINATEPTKPFIFRQLLPPALFRGFDTYNIAGLDVGTHIDLGSDGGKIPTEENDYVYVGLNFNNNQMDRISMLIVKITDPVRPEVVGRIQAIQSRGLRDLKIAKIYNAPFLKTVAFLSYQDGITAIDVTKSTDTENLTTLFG